MIAYMHRNAQLLKKMGKRANGNVVLSALINFQPCVQELAKQPNAAVLIHKAYKSVCNLRKRRILFGSAVLW